jgi:hypothetical protein
VGSQAVVTHIWLRMSNFFISYKRDLLIYVTIFGPNMESIHFHGGVAQIVQSTIMGPWGPTTLITPLVDTGTLLGAQTPFILVDYPLVYLNSLLVLGHFFHYF